MITVSRWRKGATGEYIGRAMPRQGLRGSPLGNPFKLGKGDSRDEVIMRYSQYLNYMLKLGKKGTNTAGQAVLDELSRLTELARTGDLVLLCWCKENGVGPACHGDVVKAIIEARLLD